MSSFSVGQTVWNYQKQSSKVINDKTGKITDDPIALTPFPFLPPQLQWHVTTVAPERRKNVFIEKANKILKIQYLLQLKTCSCPIKSSAQNIWVVQKAFFFKYIFYLIESTFFGIVHLKISDFFEQ